MPYYEGIFDDLEELKTRPDVRIGINTFELPEEEADRLTSQYAGNSKISFYRLDYRFDENQQYADARATEPWF